MLGFKAKKPNLASTKNCFKNDFTMVEIYPLYCFHRGMIQELFKMFFIKICAICNS